jgi:23S rRNA (uridine2552-2'-O)-methyltransferase
VERKKNQFNKAWMQEHVTDHYVHEAKRLGYRARAAFKLLELDAKDSLLRPGSLIVDLGSAPGSWSQVAAAKLKGRSVIIALDVLPMDPVPGVTFIQGDFTQSAVLEALERTLEGRPVDLVLSDMAPNLSGVASVDQARGVNLAELALEFAGKRLKPQGTFLVKLFQGEGFEEYRRQMQEVFSTVAVRKPKASRDRSSELYLLGKGLKAGSRSMQS